MVRLYLLLLLIFPISSLASATTPELSLALEENELSDSSHLTSIVSIKTDRNVNLELEYSIYDDELKQVYNTLDEIEVNRTTYIARHFKDFFSKSGSYVLELKATYENLTQALTEDFIVKSSGLQRSTFGWWYVIITLAISSVVFLFLKRMEIVMHELKHRIDHVASQYDNQDTSE